MTKNNRISHTVNAFSRLSFVIIFAALLLGIQPVPVARAATITVDSTADNLTAGDGNCTLREAIMNANLPGGGDTTSGDCTVGDTGADTITLPDGTYTLSLTGTGEDANATGDLDITDGLTINGQGAGITIVDADGIDRSIHIIGAITVEINDLTVTGGRVGYLDAVFANHFQTNQYCQGDGTGSFTCANVSSDLDQSHGVALGDMNGDGNLDTIFDNWGGRCPTLSGGWRWQFHLRHRQRRGR